MVIDSSALLAILFEEPEQADFSEAMEGGWPHLLSAVNALEAALVVESRKGATGGRELDLLLHRGRVDIVPFTEEHFEIARQAWRKYGKGNHTAGLNLADCCAYALSKSSGEPLLFKGNDFKQTDVNSVLKI